MCGVKLNFCILDTYLGDLQLIFADTTIMGSLPGGGGGGVGGYLACRPR